MSNKKFPTAAALGVLYGLFLIAFLNIYIPSYVTKTDSEVIRYIVSFLDRFFEFVLPLIAATMLFAGSTVKIDALIGRTAILSAASLGYNLPFYYLIYLAQGNDSLEAVLISLGVSAIAYLAFAAYTLLYYLAMRTVTVLTARRRYIEKLPPAYRQNTPKDMVREASRSVIDNIDLHVKEKGIFNLTVPVSFGIFAACFIQFAVNLIYEIVGMTLTLVESEGVYSSDEAIYFVAVLLFIFAELFASHAICYLVKYILAGKEKSPNEDNEALGE